MAGRAATGLCCCFAVAIREGRPVAPAFEGGRCLGPIFVEARGGDEVRFVNDTRRRKISPDQRSYTRTRPRGGDADLPCRRMPRGRRCCCQLEFPSIAFHRDDGKWKFWKAVERKFRKFPWKTAPLAFTSKIILARRLRPYGEIRLRAIYTDAIYLTKYFPWNDGKRGRGMECDFPFHSIPFHHFPFQLSMWKEALADSH